MHNYMKLPKVALVADVSTKPLGRKLMDESDKETWDNVPNNSVLPCKIITA